MRQTVAAVVLLLLSAVPARAFVCLKAANGTCLRWVPGQATLLSFLGGPAQLANGTTSWDQNAINAANDWPALAFVTDSGMGSLKDMFAAGKAYDLTEAIEKYAPNLKKVLHVDYLKKNYSLANSTIKKSKSTSL